MGRILILGWPLFWRRRLRKWEFLELFGKNWVKWPIFGAAGAEYFDKFCYFSEKSPNFVKLKAFIAQLCLKWRGKSKKPLYIFLIKVGRFPSKGVDLCKPKLDVGFPGNQGSLRRILLSQSSNIVPSTPLKYLCASKNSFDTKVRLGSFR